MGHIKGVGSYFSRAELDARLQRAFPIFARLTAETNSRAILKTSKWHRSSCKQELAPFVEAHYLVSRAFLDDTTRCDPMIPNREQEFRISI